MERIDAVDCFVRSRWVREWLALRNDTTWLLSGLLCLFWALIPELSQWPTRVGERNPGDPLPTDPQLDPAAKRAEIPLLGCLLVVATLAQILLASISLSQRFLNLLTPWIETRFYRATSARRPISRWTIAWQSSLLGEMSAHSLPIQFTRRIAVALLRRGESLG